MCVFNSEQDYLDFLAEEDEFLNNEESVEETDIF